jgi:glycosyltransferase involved in cell wall biosynthesis
MSLVSICIPTYNGASFLEACLDSVLAQTFRDLEILIVDDHSNDESVPIAQRYAARDSRIRVVINKQNLGLTGNWNQCVLLAHGEWIKFLFQDDVLEPNCVAKMMAACSPETSMVVCKRDFIFNDEPMDARERFLQYIRKYDMDRIFPGETDIAAERFSRAVLNNMLGNFVGEPTAVLLQRSVFNRFGFFNPNLIQLCDLEYWIRVGSHTGLIYIPEILVHFRRHQKAMSSITQNSKIFREHIDELICWHDFVLHPVYAPFRCYASKQRPPINLQQVFAAKVKNAWKIARQAARERSNPQVTPLEEMRKIVGLFPGFKAVKKIPFSLRFDKYRWKIQRNLSNG